MSPSDLASTPRQKNLIAPDTSPFAKWLQSLVLAGVSGFFAALASNPFFILKTRFQSQVSTAGATTAGADAVASMAVGEQHALRGGLFGAAYDIYRSDGLVGFFRGLSAFAPRVIVASAVQLSTYDAVKEWLIRRLGVPKDGLPLVISSSFVTGVAVVAAMQPFDFAATKLVNSKTAAELAAGGGGEAQLLSAGRSMSFVRRSRRRVSKASTEARWQTTSASGRTASSSLSLSSKGASWRARCERTRRRGRQG